LELNRNSFKESVERQFAMQATKWKKQCLHTLRNLGNYWSDKLKEIFFSLYELSLKVNNFGATYLKLQWILMTLKKKRKRNVKEMTCIVH